MGKLILRWAIVAVAVWLAILIVPGIDANASDWTTIAAFALILGLLNAIVRPVLKFLSCPLIVVTLGLFVLILNGFMFWLAGVVAGALNLSFTVSDFWAALLGALVVSVVSAVLNIFVPDDHESRR